MWHEILELNSHETNSTYQAATPPQGRKHVSEVFANKANKDHLVLQTKAVLVAKGFSQVQNVDYFADFRANSLIIVS